MSSRVGQALELGGATRTACHVRRFVINCSVLAFIGSSTHEESAMNIEIHDAALEARIKKQLQATGSSSVEEVLLRPFRVKVYATLPPAA